MKRALFEILQAGRAEQTSIALVTELKTGRQAVVSKGKASGDLPLTASQLKAVVEAAKANNSGILPTSTPDDHGQLFVKAFNPPLRLFIVGAVHIAQTLAPLAALAGYEVTVIDPRRAWATPERFPGVTLHFGWPDAALEKFALDRRSAVAVLTHDPKLDDSALSVALRSDAFYIGALGSLRTHDARCQRLRHAGFGQTDLERIHAPFGLDLGGRTPPEIAVAVVAEITETLHRDTGAARRNRRES